MSELTPEAARIWVDGQLLPPGEARIDVRDPGFALGLSAIEGMRCEQGVPLFLPLHLARLERSAEVVGVGWPPRWDLEAVVREYALTLPRSAHYLRVQLTRGHAGLGSLVLSARPIAAPQPGGVRVALAEEALEWGRAGSVKHSSRLPLVLAREAAGRRGAWDALLRDADGLLIETSVANLFLVLEGVLATPDTGLPGIVRELILGLAAQEGIETHVGPLSVLELQAAEEVFLTNSSVGVLPVREVIEVVGSLPAPGPLTQLLQRRLDLRRQLGFDPEGFRFDPGTADR